MGKSIHLTLHAGGIEWRVSGALVRHFRGGRAQVGREAATRRAQCVRHPLGRDADARRGIVRDAQGTQQVTRMFESILYMIYGSYTQYCTTRNILPPNV